MKALSLFLILVSFQANTSSASSKTCLCYGFSDDGYSVPVNDGIYAYEYEERCESSSNDDGDDDCWNVDVAHKLLATNKDLENKMKNFKHNEAICFNGSKSGNDYLVQSLVVPTTQDIAELACGKKLR